MMQLLIELHFNTYKQCAFKLRIHRRDAKDAEKFLNENM